MYEESRTYSPKYRYFKIPVGTKCIDVCKHLIDFTEFCKDLGYFETVTRRSQLGNVYLKLITKLHAGKRIKIQGYYWHAERMSDRA